MNAHRIRTTQNLVMNESEQKLIAEHSAAIRELQNEFQKFFTIAKTLLPEIAETRTLQRLINEREECRKRNLDLS